MKTFFAVLFALVLSMPGMASARTFTLQWSNPTTNPAGTTFELRTKKNTEAWATVSTPNLTYSKDIAVVPGDSLYVQIRAIPPSGYMCGDPAAICQPSPWATFSGLATIDTPVLYPGTPGVNVTMTPPVSVSCPCSIWPATATPATAANTDTASVELGVKFKTTSDGSITGIRFYKGTGNGGTHTGTLWSATGTKLASATFVNETATGWQQVNFATPIPVTANTVYVASYWAPQGHYASSSNYFANPVINSPLYALSNAESVNGVYAYGAASSFPVNTYSSTNYWVDVVFASLGLVEPTSQLSLTTKDIGVAATPRDT